MTRFVWLANRSFVTSRKPRRIVSLSLTPSSIRALRGELP